MPHCFIEAPSADLTTKKKLVVQATAALKEAYPVPNADHRIYFREYAPENAGLDGSLPGEIRPICFVHGPHVTVATKSRLVEAMTEAIDEAYHLPKVMVFVEEYPLENVGLNGRLQAHNSSFKEIADALAR